VKRVAVAIVACAAVAVVVAWPAAPRDRTAPRAVAHAAVLPPLLSPVVSATLGADRMRFHAQREHGTLVARGGGLSTAFVTAGPVVQASAGRLSLRLAAVGRPGSMDRPARASATASRNRISYRRGGLTEWYANGPLGLEQGFTLLRRPAGEGPLTLAVLVGGSVLPRRSGSTVTFEPSGLTYGALSAIDARQRPVPARLELSGRTVLLRINDRAARYPLVIDPFVQQGAKLTGDGAGLARESFGTSVAVSADGSTALVGAPGDVFGAAYVFIRSGDGWRRQGRKLVPLDPFPSIGFTQFGSSVALSANGNVALIGGSGDSVNPGGAWVFARPPTSEALPDPWRQQGDKLVGDQNGSGFGWSVALSGDGSIGLIGAPLKGQGKAWIFLRAGALIPLKPGKLLCTPCRFGSSVALSADGSTALVGAPGDQDGVGAVQTFVKDATSWVNGPNVAPTTLSGVKGLGASVSIADDGATALAGGPGTDNAAGAAWLFTRSGLSWTQRARFGDPDAKNAGFGLSVALSGDASTVLARSSNVAFSFVRSGDAWRTAGTLVRDVPTSSSGEPLALSRNGATALVGTAGDVGGDGSAWAFGNRPVVTALAPTSGPTGGGTSVTITGTDFRNVRSVRFGAQAAASFTVVSQTSLRATSPPGNAGAVDVVVTTAGGRSATGAGSRYTYVSPTQPPAGDTTAPTTPGRFTARFVRGSLVLRWRASADAVGVDHYVLTRDGKTVSQLGRAAVTTTLRRFSTRRKTIIRLSAFDAAGNRSAAAALSVRPRPRPRGVPRVVPKWASRLLAWETGGRHGARPATPRPLPTWHARWKAWKASPYVVGR
jgi:IPT/TIG domain-containing protein/FG-GAP repeat protein